MPIRWLTAFIGVPPPKFEVGVDFWAAATGSTVSDRRGADGQFATLIPPDGDAYVRVQRVVDGPGGVHLDLHTGSVASLAHHAERSGARVRNEAGDAVMESPGGFTFCIVPHEGESVRPRPRTSRGGPPTLVDQVCLDIPDAAFEDEVSFWAALTGWPVRSGVRPEFSYLVRPTGMPLRLLLQRLEASDRPAVRAHLDVACGPHVQPVVAEHAGLGATVTRREVLWTTMADPAALEYCLTRRDPRTGTLE